MNTTAATKALANLTGAKITIAREEDASWNLTGANPWILASSTDRKWHVALRDSDDRPFLMVDATADEFQAERWAQTQIADAVHAQEVPTMGKIPTLKRKDVINASGLSARTIDRLVASGELPAYRIGKRGLRFHEDDVAALFRPVRSARAAAEGPSDSKQDDGTELAKIEGE